MSFSVTERRLVQNSFAQLCEIQEPVTLLFYGRLFERAPATRKMFSSDLREQGRKLMDMLRIVISSLESLEALSPQLAELGRRHTSYGVQPEHYRILLDALIWTFSQALGNDFDSETRTAWVRVMTRLNEVILDAPNPI